MPVLFSSRHLTISTVARKYPDTISGFHGCNPSYQNTHHLAEMAAERWVGNPSTPVLLVLGRGALGIRTDVPVRLPLASYWPL